MKVTAEIKLNYNNGKWIIRKKYSRLMQYGIYKFKDDWARKECIAIFQTLIATIIENVETREDVEANLKALVNMKDEIISTLMFEKEHGGDYYIESD